MGLTLVELMVSVAILAGIIMIVNSLLVSAKRAVGTSQDAITANSGARAVADRLRADLAAISKDGFLAIYTDGDGKKHLVFTTVGPYRSMVDSTVANAARIDYGVTNDDDMILWRRATLLDPTNAAYEQNDHEKMALRYYERFAEADVNNALQNNYTFTYPPPDGSIRTFTCMTAPPIMTLPPASLAEVNALWPYMTAPCSEFKIEWAEIGGLTWKNTDSTWTHEDKTNWPGALRITFKLSKSESAPSFEVIVDMP